VWLPSERAAVRGNIVSTMADSTALPWAELQTNLRAFIGRRVQNHADADDLVQRVLLQIVKGISALRDSDRLHAWVYRLARNAITDHYRSATVRREIASGDALDVGGDERTAGELQQEDERAALQELAACMAPMMNQLPAAYRDAVRLADIEGINQADAARQAGVSVSGMKSRIQRGRQQLRAVFENCCRIELDRRGSIIGYTSRSSNECGCDSCE
jgi:RNA polymerase sigma-70 factor, ECF subfamily